MEPLILNGVDPDYDQLNECLIAMAKGEPFPYTDIWLSGARQNKKTWTISDFNAYGQRIAQVRGHKAGAYAFRKYGMQIEDLRTEIRNALDRLMFKAKLNRFSDGDYLETAKFNQPRFDFGNKSFIQLRSLKSTDKAVVPLKGLASSGVKYLWVWDEEGNELTKDDYNAIRFAVRGAEHILFIHSINPDDTSRYAINYCMQNAPHDRNILVRDQKQVTHVTREEEDAITHEKYTTKQVFIYATWMLNQYLDNDAKARFREMERLDPVLYESGGLGMPGQVEGAIFKRYLEKQPIFHNFQPIKFTAGLDFGFASSVDGHPTICGLVGYDRTNKKQVLGNYCHDNSKHAFKDQHRMAREIVAWYKNMSVKYPHLQNGLTVNCDYGGGGNLFTDTLNIAAKNAGVGWLQFASVSKKLGEVKKRIYALRYELTTGQLSIPKEIAPETGASLAGMIWKKPTKDGASSEEPEDVNDDGFDGLCYAIMPDLYNDVHAPKNPLLLPKNITRRNLVHEGDKTRGNDL